jgi:hypothetical protein
MLRTIAISLVLLLSVGIMLPFANSAHGIRQSAQVTQKKSKRYRSRAWWRRHRARMRAKRAAEELARRNALMALPQNLAVSDLSAVAGPASPSMPVNTGSSSLKELPPLAMSGPITIQSVDVSAARTTTPSVPIAVAQAAPVATAAAAPAPATVSAPAVSAPTVSAHAAATATRPRVVNAVRPVIAPGSTKQLPGQMNLSVVALSRPNPIFLTQREQKKMLAGVPVADLKRIVIDKMVINGGWVVNDFVREVKGSRVFVVTARTPKDALTPEKAWTFYFTEAGGRVYGLTTEAPVEYADRMTTEAERFIESLRAKSEGTQE